jgi:alpha-D-ribose 1-methylphosphonate 5-triphosphate diphosphatase
LTFLAVAARMVSKTPPAAVDLNDRGAIAVGKRADLIQARVARSVSAVRSTWRDRPRVA